MKGTRGGGQTGKLYVEAPNEVAARVEARRRWGRGRGIKITSVELVPGQRGLKHG